jgi:hypothetical protein
MTTDTLPQRPAANRPDSRRTGVRAARRRRASDFSDAVVAAYIDEISTRDRPTARLKRQRP